jgi:hypothetical protein
LGAFFYDEKIAINTASLMPSTTAAQIMDDS